MSYRVLAISSFTESEAMNYAAILLLTHIVLIGLGIRKWIKEDLSYVKPLARSWCQQLRVCAVQWEEAVNVR